MADIIEQGVSAVEYQILPTELRVHQPHDGVAKWFIDENGTQWCKFTTEIQGVLTQHVVKANLIVEVRYDKSLNE